MFETLGRWIARRPAVCVGVWVLALVGATVYTRVSPPVTPAEVGSFLPPHSPHSISSDIIKDALPAVWSNSMMAIVAHRPGGLTPSDILWLDRAVNEARDRAADLVKAGTLPGQVPAKVTALSPATPFVRDRLMSRDRQAALALVNLPTSFISEGTIHAVDAADKVIRNNPPAGLELEITGPAGIGHDYFQATERAVHRTTWVTVFAVLGILVLVYRSPFGALVPLVSIGVSVYLAFVLLGALSHVGWEISSMERIFCVVLMFGAGVDYALFWIARYREALGEQLDAGGENRSEAAMIAMRETGPAILASAATCICGMTTMLAADLIPSRNAGKVLAVAIAVALLASLTLAPALARWLGKYLFWPMGVRGKAAIGQRVAWPVVADFVTRRPLPVLALGTTVLAVLALWATQFPPRFDALQELPPDTSSSRGLAIANAHFDRGQLYPNTVLAVYPAGQAPADLAAASRAITSAIAGQEGVNDVYSLDRPVGRQSSETSVPAALLGMMTRALYQGKTSDGQTVLRFEVLLDHLPFSNDAIECFQRVQSAAREIGGANGAAPQILLSGLTSYIISVKNVVDADQKRVMGLATIIISLIVLAMVRSIPLTLFMIVSTWLTYGATITLSNLFLIHVKGLSGLDWKVRLILFVIVVAVGQDYNIFLVSRLLRRRDGKLDTPGPESPGRESLLKPSPGGSLFPPITHREHVRDAIIRTGSVISSCGIIMAATLGSLWAGGLSLLMQLGFSLALGILIDTFFVRPLLIPSFYLLLTSRRHASS